MHFYNYIFSILAGMVFANSIPHFIHGISGNKFPTPFARPPGRGLSSSTVNVIWALGNIIIASLFFRLANVALWNLLAYTVCFVGFAFISIFSSINFAKKERE